VSWSWPRSQPRDVDDARAHRSAGVEEVADDRHRLAREAAEQLRDRQPERLALQVEQRHLDAGDRVGGDPGPVARVLLEAMEDPLDA